MAPRAYRTSREIQFAWNQIVIDGNFEGGDGLSKEPTTAEQFEADYQKWFGRTLEYEEYDTDD